LASPIEAQPGPVVAILADYITEDELASGLQVTRRTLRRWHATREGPPRTKVGGGRILYRRASVDRWLQGRESGGRSAA
jgi:predicted DNA-binding transcriptional regulator AlpA